MTNQIPLKVIRTLGDTTALAEYQSGDTIPVGNGGTGSDNAAQALTNLGGMALSVFNLHANNTSNPHSVTAGQIGAIPSSLLGANNGVATLDGGGKVPVGQIPAAAIPSLHVVADSVTRLALTVQEGDEAKQLDDSTHWIYDGATWHLYPAPSIFGEGFSNVNEFVTSVTTSTTFQSKASLSFPVIAGRTYRIGWFYQWNHDSVSNDFEAQIMFNGNEYIRQVQEPKDSAGSSFDGSGSNQRMLACGFDYWTAPTTETLTIDINYRTSTGGTRSAIWETRIEQWRVL